MCSRKWVIPFRRCGSEREPTPTKRFTETAWVVGIGVVTTRRPDESVVCSHVTANVYASAAVVAAFYEPHELRRIARTPRSAPTAFRIHLWPQFEQECGDGGRD